TPFLPAAVPIPARPASSSLHLRGRIKDGSPSVSGSGPRPGHYRVSSHLLLGTSHPDPGPLWLERSGDVDRCGAARRNAGCGRRLLLARVPADGGGERFAAARSL